MTDKELATLHDETDSLIIEAQYRNYRFNRIRTPHIPPKDYEICYPNYADMERRLQDEQTARRLEGYHKCSHSESPYGGGR